MLNLYIFCLILALSTKTKGAASCAFFTRTLTLFLLFSLFFNSSFKNRNECAYTSLMTRPYALLYACVMTYMTCVTRLTREKHYLARHDASAK